MNSRELKAARLAKLARRYAAAGMFGVEPAADDQQNRTLAAFDALESDARAERRDQVQQVREAARSAL